MCSKSWRLETGLLLSFFKMCGLFVSGLVHANLLDISLSFSFGFMAIYQFMLMAVSFSNLLRSWFENGNLGQMFT